MKVFNSTEENDFIEAYNNNINIAFHGTCSYYSENIESNGFIKGYAIFNQEQINCLIGLLENDEQYQCVNQNLAFYGGEERISAAIKSTFESLKSSDYTFTMGSDYKTAKSFLSDEYKCGQYLKNIKTVISDIKKLGLSDYPKSVNEIINIIDDINKSNGVIYSIDINSLEIENDGSRLHVNGNIKKNRIKGKIEIN